MTDYNRTECYEKLAPEAKAFLKEAAGMAGLPVSMETYKTSRHFVEVMSAKMKESVKFKGKIQDRRIPGPSGDISIRIYTPESGEPLSTLLFYHGGGWIFGNLDMEESICLALAADTPCSVVSVDYRLAPEHPFPAGLNDCYAALEWVAGDAHAPRKEGSKIAVSGESAGANLATAVTLMAKGRGGPAIAFQVLFYPVVNLSGFDTESHRAFEEGFLLRRMDMEGSRSLYVPNEKDRLSPLASPLLAPDLTGLPPALIVTAGCDPLRDEGEAYGRRLREAGVEVNQICYEDMIHGFLYFLKKSASAKKALMEASSALRGALK